MGNFKKFFRFTISCFQKFTFGKIVEFLFLILKGNI
jgi:hypothetical protein